MDKKQTMKALQEAILLYEKNLANRKILILYETCKKIYNTLEKINALLKKKPAINCRLFL